MIIQDGMVESILPTVALKVTATKQVPLLIPAFIDLQIYGAGGKLLSVYPTVESLQLLKDYCVKGGAAWFQPTVATNSNEVIHACIDAVRQFKKTTE